MLKITIAGKAGTGKSAVAQMLAEHFQRMGHMVDLSDPEGACKRSSDLLTIVLANLSGRIVIETQQLQREPTLKKHKLTDGEIDAAILACPMHGTAVMNCMASGITVQEFRQTLRAWARAVIEAADK